MERASVNTILRLTRMLAMTNSDSSNTNNHNQNKKVKVLRKRLQKAWHRETRGSCPATLRTPSRKGLEFRLLGFSPKGHSKTSLLLPSAGKQSATLAPEDAKPEELNPDLQHFPPATARPYGHSRAVVQVDLVRLRGRVP